MNHLVSIIIPCYNSEKWIRDSVNSCIAQSYRKIEIIIVDDASSDNTLSIIHQLSLANPGLIRYTSQANGGSSSARNRGISMCKGDYFIFLDSDDILLPDSVDNFLNIIYTQQVDIAVGDWINFFDDSVVEEYCKSIPYYPNDYFASLLKRPPVPSAFMFKRNLQPWNENMRVWEVLDYFFSLLLQDYSVGYVYKPVVRIRQHESPHRVSIQYNHFEAFVTGKVFSLCKQKLISQEKLTLARSEALDAEILANAYTLVRHGESKKATELTQYISWDKVPQYKWFKRTGVSGWAWLFGPEMGMSMFCSINRLLDRT